MHPSVKFDRMKTQEGTFLYQLAHYNGNTRKYIGFIEFIINDKRKFYTTLNKMGINQKTIFPDYCLNTHFKTK